MYLATIDQGQNRFVSTLTPNNGAFFAGRYNRIADVFLPPSTGFQALVQIVNTSQTEPLTVFVDNLEVLPSPEGRIEFGLSEAVAMPQEQNITISLPNLPVWVKPLEMVYIPAGTFRMGSPDSEKNRWDGEGPQHQVTLTKPFYMGKYEVTQAQWLAVMGSNPSKSKGANLPIEWVSWNDCQIFIQKLNLLGQGTFRLPTEAEWEYACRAGTTTRFFWGDDFDYNLFWQYAWNADNSSLQAHEVGLLRPNAWRLHDMSGNVSEWCQDWSDRYPSEPQTDPTGSNTDFCKIYRGGGWGSIARNCRSASRGCSSPFNLGIGVRVVRTAPANPLIPEIDGLHIDNVSQAYSAPYMLDYSFTLRDNQGQAILADPALYKIKCLENNNLIHQNETGAQLMGAPSKLLKCFLVLNHTRRLADPATNGDDDGDGISNTMETMEASAKYFVDALQDDAQVGIYEFHNDQDPIRISEFVNNKAYLKNQIDRILKDPVQSDSTFTRCWDAVFAAVQEFGIANMRDEQRFVLFLSDGRDETSQRKPADIIAEANAKGVKIYPIGFGTGLDDTQLKTIAEQTHGEYYAADSVAAMAERFLRINRDLDGQYTLRWISPKRGSIPFTPSFQISLGGQNDTFTGAADSYMPSQYNGVTQQGILRFVGSKVVDGQTTVFLRAEYVPDCVRILRLFIKNRYAFTVDTVPKAEGGLCGDWNLTVTYDPAADGKWITVESKTPKDLSSSIPFGAFGPILKFELTGIDEDKDPTGLPGNVAEVLIDNTVYQQTGNPYFNIVGLKPFSVTIPLPLPSGAKPQEMVYIPAGTFSMGASYREDPDDPNEDSWRIEAPQHPVTISRPFWMGQCEVTQAQWQAVMGNNPSYYKGDDHPVHFVSWDDCQTFIEKLNQLGQGTFRLPTEAEWEYAFRAGTTTRFFWGDDFDYNQIWQFAWCYDHNSGPHEVGLKLPNAWGLFDMSGNVLEWCQDWYDYYSWEAQTDPAGSDSGSFKVVRGGCYISSPAWCRSAYRHADIRGFLHEVFGFRIVRNP